jgi:hypothetical protein
MKKKLVYLACFLSFFACKKEPSTPSLIKEKIKESNGSLSAKMNGNTWSHPYVTGYIGADSKFEINTSFFEGEIERQNLSISTIDLNTTEEQRINKHAAPNIGIKTTSIFFAHHDDAGEDDYIVLENSDTRNYVIIEDYDAARKEITGSFQLTLYRKGIHKPQAQGLPDTMRFTEGKFHATLK